MLVRFKMSVIRQPIYYITFSPFCQAFFENIFLAVQNQAEITRGKPMLVHPGGQHINANGRDQTGKHVNQIVRLNVHRGTTK